MEALYQGQLSSRPFGWKVHKLWLNSGIELCYSRGTRAVGICLYASVCGCVHSLFLQYVALIVCVCVTPKQNESRYNNKEVLKVSMFSLVLTDSCRFERCPPVFLSPCDFPIISPHFNKYPSPPLLFPVLHSLTATHHPFPVCYKLTLLLQNNLK